MEVTRIYTEKDVTLTIKSQLPRVKGDKDVVAIQKGTQAITLTEQEAMELSNLLDLSFNY